MKVILKQNVDPQPRKKNLIYFRHPSNLIWLALHMYMFLGHISHGRYLKVQITKLVMIGT